MGESFVKIHEALGQGLQLNPEYVFIHVVLRSEKWLKYLLVIWQLYENRFTLQGCFPCGDMKNLTVQDQIVFETKWPPLWICLPHAGAFQNHPFP